MVSVKYLMLYVLEDNSIIVDYLLRKLVKVFAWLKVTN